MRKILLGLLILQPFFCFSQKEFDSKIVLTVSDTTGLYEKTKMALLFQDLIVAENPSKDTLTAVERYFVAPFGFIITKVAASGNKLSVFGIYGLVRKSEWNYPKIPRNYNKIIYYKGSKVWPFMLQRAKRIYMGELSYEK